MNVIVKPAENEDYQVSNREVVGSGNGGNICNEVRFPFTQSDRLHR